jgi:hypothetical protein
MSGALDEECCLELEMVICGGEDKSGRYQLGNVPSVDFEAVTFQIAVVDVFPQILLNTSIHPYFLCERLFMTFFAIISKYSIVLDFCQNLICG